MSYYDSLDIPKIYIEKHLKYTFKSYTSTFKGTNIQCTTWKIIIHRFLFNLMNCNTYVFPN